MMDSAVIAQRRMISRAEGEIADETDDGLNEGPTRWRLQ